jgi:hypothetical protein
MHAHLTPIGKVGSGQSAVGRWCFLRVPAVALAKGVDLLMDFGSHQPCILNFEPQQP